MQPKSRFIGFLIFFILLISVVVLALEYVSTNYDNDVTAIENHTINLFLSNVSVMFLNLTTDSNVTSANVTLKPMLRIQADFETGGNCPGGTSCPTDNFTSAGPPTCAINNNNFVTTWFSKGSRSFFIDGGNCGVKTTLNISNETLLFVDINITRLSDSTPDPAFRIAVINGSSDTILYANNTLGVMLNFIVNLSNYTNREISIQFNTSTGDFTPPRFHIDNVRLGNESSFLNYSLDIGGDGILDYANSSNFTSTINNLILNVTALNNYVINRCTHYNCSIPFNFTRDINSSVVLGVLNYSGFSVLWSDIRPPKYFNNKTNTSTIRRHDTIHFNINLSDGVNISTTTFGWNGTTNNFINVTNTTFSSDTKNYSFSLINHTNWSRGTKVTWRQYTNDTSGNWNISEMSFVIANTLPTVNNALINNTPITSTRSANGSASYSDLDNDTSSATAFQWFVNGIYNKTGDNQSLFLFGNYTTDDTLMVSIRYYDGFDWSGWSNSSTVTVGDATPPLVPWYQTNNLTITTRINSTINFSMNVTDVGSNVLSVNFSLNLSAGTIADKSFTIPSGQKSVNVSYEIFKSAETLTNGNFNITNFRVCDSSQNCNSTTDAASFPNWRGLNFTVNQSPFPTATFELRFISLTNAAGNTNNFTVRAIGDSDITTINFTLNSTTVDKTMTVPSGQKNVNVSYEIFKSDETLATGSYNITNVRICDLSGFCNSTTSAASFPSWAGLSFAVTAANGGTPSGGGSGGGGGCDAGFTNVNGTCIPTSNVTANLTRAPRCGDTFCDAFAGEDIFSCPLDCPLNKVRASYLTCTDPTQPCFFKTQKVVAYAIGFIIGGGVLFLSVSKGGKGKDTVERAKNWLRRRFWKSGGG